MGLPSDPRPQLPTGPRTGVDVKGAGCFPLGETKLAALPDQPTGERPLIDRLWVIAKEPDKGRDELNCRLRRPYFPIVNRPGVHTEQECGLLLGDRQDETLTADMLPKGLSLEVVRLPNQ